MLSSNQNQNQIAKCPNCGKGIQSNWQLCLSCGADLTPASHHNPELIQPIPISEIHSVPQPTRNGTLTKRWYIIVAVLVLVLGIGTIWYSSTADDRLFQQAITYQKAGQYQEAINTSDRLLSKYPKSQFSSRAKDIQSAAHLAWAEELVQAGEFAESIDQFRAYQEVKETTPDGEGMDDKIAGAYIQWGQALASESSFQEAIDRYDLVIADYPNSTWVGDAEDGAIKTYIDWARYNTKNQQREQAIQHYKTVLSDYPFKLASLNAKIELHDLYIEQAENILARTKNETGDIRPLLKQALHIYQDALALQPMSSTASKMVNMLNRDYSLPVYAWNGTPLIIIEPISSNTTFIPFTDKIAVVERTIESASLKVSLEDDILVSYTSSLSSIYGTLDHLEYSVKVDVPKAGLHKVTIKAKVYKEGGLSSFLSSIFLENQEVTFMIWVK